MMSHFQPIAEFARRAITEVMCLDNNIVANYRAGGVEPRELTFSQAPPIQDESRR